MTNPEIDPWERECVKCGTRWRASYSESCPNCEQPNSFYAKLPADKIAAQVELEAREVQRLERENARLREALVQIEALSPKRGGVGQIARDALRLGK